VLPKRESEWLNRIRESELGSLPESEEDLMGPMIESYGTPFLASELRSLSLTFMAGDWIIGLDIGGTKTAVVAGDRRGVVVHREQFATGPGRGFDDVFSRMLESIAHVVAHMGTLPGAVSVSVGGPLDVLRGIVKSPPNLPGWTDIPLKEMLARHMHVPVFVEHDGNAGALAEWYFGAGKGFRNIVFVTMGTGFGAGLILEGRLYRGTSDVAGEIGHVRVAEDGPDCYGKSGSLEGYGSGTGIARLARMMYPSLWGEGRDRDRSP
jgi:glucokinase